MEKSAPEKYPAKHPEQLALPLEESTPPTPERKDSPVRGKHLRDLCTTNLEVARRLHIINV
jgi:hypothetical protein